MRLYQDFSEAQNEIRRDLAELGIEVHPETMQDKYVADNPDFNTRELYNYDYSVLNPAYTLIEGVHADWVSTEWEDRLSGYLNPGRAWGLRPEVWEQFLEDKGQLGGVKHRGFSYTYSERMGGHHIDLLIDELKKHPNSRQLWLPVWDRQIDENRRGERRVPCSLGYWFVNREDRLHITYMMRSCDFATHWANDVCLASILLHHIAREAGLKVGSFTHFVGSLHVYAKDVAGVF